jgi:lysophospholipase L1-like esterase
MKRAVVALILASAALWGGLVGAEEVAAPPAEAPERVLVVGDSMAWALANALRPLVEQEGGKFRVRSRTSDSIRGYAVNHKMQSDVRETRPDVVIISLGANEALVPRPEGLATYIQRIVKEVGPRECYWVGPPMWRPDTGVVKLLAEHASPCRFFNSSELTLERRPDGIHPNPEGSKVWAQAVYDWIKAQRNAPQEAP